MFAEAIENQSFMLDPLDVNEGAWNSTNVYTFNGLSCRVTDFTPDEEWAQYYSFTQYQTTTSSGFDKCKLDCTFREGIKSLYEKTTCQTSEWVTQKKIASIIITQQECSNSVLSLRHSNNYLISKEPFFTQVEDIMT
eukprot:UN31880